MLEKAAKLIKSKIISLQNLNLVIQLFKILKLKLYYIRKPKIVFGNKKELILLEITKCLNVHDINELDSDSLLSDLF